LGGVAGLRDGGLNYCGIFGVNYSESWQLGTMKKLIIFAFLAIPELVSAYRQGEPTDFSKKLTQSAIERTTHIVRYDGS
jgi:hypothetical protein